MVKNNPENAVAREKAEERPFRDARHFTGPLPRNIEAFAAGLGGSVGSSLRTNGQESLDKKGMPPCGARTTVRKTRGVDLGDAIGKELQNLYDDLVAQPVPDRFLNLLNQLEKNMVSSGVSNSAPRERE